MPLTHYGTWFAGIAAAGKPKTKVSKKAVVGIVYAMGNGLSVGQTMDFSNLTFNLCKETVIDRRHLILRAVSAGSRAGSRHGRRGRGSGDR